MSESDVPKIHIVSGQAGAVKNICIAKSTNILRIYNEVYRRLARHSPRAEANYAIQYNTVPCNTIYKVMKYTKYHL